MAHCDSVARSKNGNFYDEVFKLRYAGGSPHRVLLA